MGHFEVPKDRDTRLGGNHIINTDACDDFPREQSNVGPLTNEEFIPEVRICDYRAFKNRFSPEDAHYAVDVLVSGALLNQEEAEELSLRRKLIEYARKGNSKQNRVSKFEKAALKKNSLALEEISKEQSRDVWVQRIRIQSPALLTILAKAHGESWTSREKTYVRPFSTLHYYHDHMKDVLEDLKTRWVSSQGTDSTHSSSITSAHDGSFEAVDDCPAALAALRCYVDWFDAEILPDWARFQKDNYTGDVPGGVRFDDLNYVFRTGDFLYRPQEASGSIAQGYGEAKRIWRAYEVRIPNVQLGGTHSHHREDGASGDENNAVFTVRAFHLEYNGVEFVPIPKNFHIPPYVGSVPVVSLPIYPARFCYKTPALLSSATKVGIRTLEYIEPKHATYIGWAVTRTPGSETVSEAEHAEHVNSEVVVDFTEAFQAVPRWKPTGRIMRKQPVSQEISLDVVPVLVWANAERTRLLGETSELVASPTGINVSKRNAFLESDGLLRAMTDNEAAGRLTTAAYLREEDRMLLSGRVFAYVFTRRKFAQLNAELLTPARQTSDALDSLRIPDGVKGFIRGVIRGHLMHKKAEKERGGASRGFDLIQGKGAGLSILLHGVPGVGKTATAEAMAEAHGKPLFHIACGDLGLEPDQVENNLRGIFRLAGLWDCILLLDEVDTFFSQRSKADAAMNKNALVSVFLRVLDYYTGILFLTTNRAGAIDEAFKSRIHCKIYYPPLDRRQTLEIWQLNIDRLKRTEPDQRQGPLAPLQIPEREILQFAADHFDRNEDRRMDHQTAGRRVSFLRRETNTATATTGQWNGRQIRNAFQVARYLAYSEAQTVAEQLIRGEVCGQGIGPPAPRLNVQDFKMLSHMTDDFDDYMREIYGGQNDAQIQRDREERADHFVPRQRQPSPRYETAEYPLVQTGLYRKRNRRSSGSMPAWGRLPEQNASLLNSVHDSFCESDFGPWARQGRSVRPGEFGVEMGGPSPQNWNWPQQSNSSRTTTRETGRDASRQLAPNEVSPSLKPSSQERSGSLRKSTQLGYGGVAYAEPRWVSTSPSSHGRPATAEDFDVRFDDEYYQERNLYGKRQRSG